MDLNARFDVNCGRKDGRTENRTPISHLAKAVATIKQVQHKHENIKFVLYPSKKNGPVLAGLTRPQRPSDIGHAHSM